MSFAFCTLVESPREKNDFQKWFKTKRKIKIFHFLIIKNFRRQCGRELNLEFTKE